MGETGFYPEKEAWNTGAKYYEWLAYCFIKASIEKREKNPREWWSWLESAYDLILAKMTSQERHEADQLMDSSNKLLNKYNETLNIATRNSLTNFHRYIMLTAEKYGMLTPKTEVEDPGKALRSRGW